MRHLNYLEDEDRLKKMQAQKKSFQLAPHELQLLEDPMMIRLLELGKKNQDGSRSF